jgi:SAM-dependent methyltransferase
MTYRPREFWDQRLSEHFDLRGTGETGLSLAYNRACYTLRREVLERSLADAGVTLDGRRVLDVGCGTGFFTAFYLQRGAKVTGIDIAPTSIERLSRRHPEATFVLADIAEHDVPTGFDVVNAFDVLYHITDDARFAAALDRLGRAVRPGGVLLVTDTFAPSPAAAHNRMRPLAAYRERLEPLGFTFERPRPTHVLLNRELKALRFLNRAPRLLLAADRLLLGLGAGQDGAVSKLLVARRSPDVR